MDASSIGNFDELLTLKQKWTQEKYNHSSTSDKFKL